MQSHGGTESRAHSGKTRSLRAASDATPPNARIQIVTIRRSDTECRDSSAEVERKDREWVAAEVAVLVAATNILLEHHMEQAGEAEHCPISHATIHR